ncbi:plakophilin-1 [Platichthys flesus]|uniref:plakophilin-1 n=1 Tax=Platichthys flesus TaxID=8260 RepID=UPI002DB64FC2|nr:plakophilin-1 [Platichthys flesus]
MTALEPLRSAMTVRGVEDTSLALPSDKKLRSGQQRVLEQVHTIKRGKSKSWKNGHSSSSASGLFEQSLTSDSEFGSFKFTPSKANGTFSYSSSSMSAGPNMSAGHNKAIYQKSRSMPNRATRGRYQSTSGGWEQQVKGSNWPQGPSELKASRSDPALVPQFSAGPAMRAKGQALQSQHSLYASTNRHSTYSMTNGNNMTNSQTRIVQQPSAHSYTEGRMGTMKTTKMHLQQSAVDSGINVSELTLKQAVEYLSHPDENFKQCGATFIQHTTFNEERSKEEVLELGGIPPLVKLLESPSPGVGQAAAGALRNLVFKDKNNKLEVQHCGGIGKALQLLKKTDSTDTQKQITGLLWNLSSTDELKTELTQTALPALTENVVVPFTCWSDNSANNNIHPDVFCNATGCLRNLSCCEKGKRQEMRQCSGLIDSLMSYIQSCVAEDNPDDKSVENCVCILHNLSYQLEVESPASFAKYCPQIERQPESKKSPPIGCFSPRSGKVQKEFLFDMDQAMPEDSSASGEKWLCHPKAMKTYLSLLGSSQKDGTLEACCGALRNLTAGNGGGSVAVSRILVQKLGALPHVSPLLKSSCGALQKAAISLMSNMCRVSSVQPTMARQILPDLTSLLSAGPREMGKDDKTISAACNTARTLMLAEPEIGKKVLNEALVRPLADLSENGSFPKGSTAASLLLYNLWNEKSLQGAAKKLGLAKSLFVNDNTTQAQRSAQIID